MLNEVYSLYLKREIKALSADKFGIDKRILQCVKLQAEAKLDEAFAIIRGVPMPDDPVNQTLYCVERAFLEMKLGHEINFSYLNIVLKRKSKFTNLIHYIYYSWHFWIDAEVANFHLRRLILSAIKSCDLGCFFQGIFLYCHMKVIDGVAIGFHCQLASLIFCAVLPMRKAKYVSDIWTNIIVASFPYTLVVGGKLDRLSQLSQQFQGLNLNDPYYAVLFNISSLYGFAYSGNVEKAFEFCERFSQVQRNTNLIRYKSIVQIMKIIPLCLQGYSQLIEKNFRRILAQHNEANCPNLVNSQFYRAASLISLITRDFENSERNIIKSIKFRELTKSFSAWKRFDSGILEQARSKKVNIEYISELLGVCLDIKPLHLSIGLFISDLYSNLEFFEENAINPYFVAEVEKFFDCCAILIDETTNTELSQTESLLKLTLPNGDFVAFRSNSNDAGALAASLPLLSVILQQFSDKIRILIESKNNTEEIEIGRLAKSVAHDIRSPLGALNLVISSLNQVDIGKRELLRQAVARINSIAADLLNYRKRNEISRSGTVGSFRPAIALKEIIQEKQLELFQCSIQLRLDDAVDRILTSMAIGNESDFKRIVSNIINNSIEAFGVHDENKTIDIGIEESGNMISIKVVDNGCGFSNEVLQRLWSEKVTTKADGNGLGLFHSRRVLKLWNGDLSITPLSEFGTLVTIRLQTIDIQQKGPFFDSNSIKEFPLENS